MDFTTDKLRSLVKKWQTLIEAHVDVKTTDSYTLRLFCIAFTKRRANQVKRTCYAQSSQIRQVIPLHDIYIYQNMLCMKWLRFDLVFLLGCCRFAGRWVRLWWRRLHLVTLRSLLPSSSLSPSEEILRRPLRTSTRCRTCSSVKSRSSRLPSLTSASSWRWVETCFCHQHLS